MLRLPWEFKNTGEERPLVKSVSELYRCGNMKNMDVANLNLVGNKVYVDLNVFGAAVLQR